MTIKEQLEQALNKGLYPIKVKGKSGISFIIHEDKLECKEKDFECYYNVAYLKKEYVDFLVRDFVDEVVFVKYEEIESVEVTECIENN